LYIPGYSKVFSENSDYILRAFQIFAVISTTTSLSYLTSPVMTWTQNSTPSFSCTQSHT